MRRSPIERRRLRAPRRHGEYLIDPPLDAAGELLQENLAQTGAPDCDLQGRSLTELRDEARRGLLRQARRYTSEYRNVAGKAETPEAPVLLSGHQPELFHPGVWFKTFALAALGTRLAGHAVHLLIDNDLVRASTIRVPAGSPANPRVENIPFDEPAAACPFEDRAIRSRDVFASFGIRVQNTVRPFVADPLIRDLWPLAIRAARSCDNLGQCLARARHGLEEQWGLNTLELPFSRVCETVPFRWFAVHLLAQLPRFWDVYNASLAEYRVANRVRSRSHPVPELASEDDWLEAPFWIWTAGDLQRRALFVRARGDQFELTDRQRLQLTVSLVADGDGERAVDQLGQFAAGGIRFRPRALITTMYCRLVLGDLFLHGIGGAKYDQLTDRIVQRFFGVEPPAFLTLSATAQLPVDSPQVSGDDLRRVNTQIRRLAFHPEEYVDGVSNGDGGADEPLARLLAEKRRWIAENPRPGRGRPRHQAIRRLNDALQPYVAVKRGELLAARERIVDDLRRAKMLNSREYSFCLFPEKTLRPLLLDFFFAPA